MRERIVRNDKKVNRVRSAIVTLLAALLVIGLSFACAHTSVYAEGEGTGSNSDGPKVSKTVESNGDGTYTLSLSITGVSSTSVQGSGANILVVLDTSGSMKDATYEETDSNAHGSSALEQYGLVNGSYIRLTYYNGEWGYYSSWNWIEYTGQRYVRGASTRIKEAKAAIQTLADTLYGQADTHVTIHMALATFSTRSNGMIQGWTRDKQTFKSAVGNISDNASGGTNWEAALKHADGVQNPPGNAYPTYVIFVSDGNPTYWLNGGGLGGTGQEDEGNITTSYNEAKDDAENIVAHGKKLYTLAIYGNVNRMAELAGYAGAQGNYTATDTEAMNAAFAKIAYAITNASGFKDVKVTDTVTAGTSTNLHAVNGNVDGFGYCIDGQPWTDAPAASFENGSVRWDLGERQLENGKTYTVKFKVWPSQAAYDRVAELNNGTGSPYNDTTDAANGIVKKGSKYFLKTNTGNEFSYTKVETKTASQLPAGAVLGQADSEGYTWSLVDGSYIGTKTRTGTVSAEQPEPVGLTDTTMSVVKIWNHDIVGDKQQPAEVSFDFYRDGSKYAVSSAGSGLTLSEENAWRKDDIHIAPGIITEQGGSYTVLEPGHEHTVTEQMPAGYQDYYDLDAPTLRPMLINGTLTMLIREDSRHQPAQGAEIYSINGENYYVGQDQDAILKATNIRRSNLNIKKVAKNADGSDYQGDTLFEFRAIVGEAGGPDVWFAIKDADGNLVRDEAQLRQLMPGASLEQKDGAYTGYASSAAGTPVVFKLKNNYNLRFINLPIDTGYQITELASSTFDHTDIQLTSPAGSSAAIDLSQGKIEGKIDKGDEVYQVVYTNTRKVVDLTLKKTVTGNMGETDKAFAFTVRVDGQDHTFQVGSNDENTLKNGQEVTIQVPAGRDIIVTETEAGQNGYTTTAMVDGQDSALTDGKSYTFTALKKSSTIEFLNDRTTAAPTSLNQTYRPYMLMIFLAVCIVVALGAAALFRKKRRSGRR